MSLLNVRRIDTDSRGNLILIPQAEVPEPAGCVANLAITVPVNFNPGQSITANFPFEAACSYDNQTLNWFVTLDDNASVNNTQSPDALGGGSFSPTMDPRNSTDTSTGEDYLDYNGSIKVFSPDTEVANYLDTHTINWSAKSNPISFLTNYEVLDIEDSIDAGLDVPVYSGGFGSPSSGESSANLTDPPYNPAATITLVITNYSSATFKWYVKTDDSASVNNVQAPEALGGGDSSNYRLQPRYLNLADIFIPETASQTGEGVVAATYIPYNGIITTYNSVPGTIQQTVIKQFAKFGQNASPDGTISKEFSTNYIILS